MALDAMFSEQATFYLGLVSSDWPGCAFHFVQIHSQFDASRPLWGIWRAKQFFDLILGRTGQISNLPVSQIGGETRDLQFVRSERNFARRASDKAKSGQHQNGNERVGN